jgi:hypothetical protein
MTFEEFIDEDLFGIKPKKVKKVKTIKESETDIKKILGEADEEPSLDAEKSAPEGDKEKPIETKKDTSSLSAKDAKSDKSKKTVEKKEVDGELVMTVQLSISDEDQGKIEIGDKEYLGITNINALLSLYDIDTNNVTDPEKTTETLQLSVQEVTSKGDHNSVLLVMRSNVDGTVSINVLVNDLGTTFEDINAAITFFNTQYVNNIINIINKNLHNDEE